MKWLVVVAILLGACSDDETGPSTDAGPIAATVADDVGNNDAGNDDAGPLDGDVADAGSVDASGPIDVDRDRIVDLLRPNEVDAVCRDFRAQFDMLVPAEERLRFNCTVTGIFTAGFDESISTDEELQTACVPIRDMCVEQGSMTDDFVCPIDGDDDCSLTVGQVETCFIAESAATAEFFSTITCDEATLEQADGEGLGDAPLPEECEAVYDACPQLR